ncbi:hypothetical protein HMPREF0666_01358 [Prevotella sp. C561]|nr:DUF4846 domain-containing protein [Prevotella sp. C561]EGW47481.1 hypothetical protein HMPREF0666_01358 [Prevotella sp. C561]
MMKTTYTITFLLATFLLSCTGKTNGQIQQPTEKPSTVEQTTMGNQQRLAPPPGYEKVKLSEGTFGYFLRHLPLKPVGSDLHYYNGSIKQKNYAGAVVDIDFGHGEVEQCADAVIFLRALWLWTTKQYDKIHFNFTNGFRADYIRWAKGERIHIDKRTWRCSYSKDTGPDYSYKTFRKYLNLVFTYAGTASLEKELANVTGKELQVGDVIINGGHPGHTVIVVDKAVNKKGEAVYLLAQGYTPAQEIEIFNQWFCIDPQVKYLETPNWYFRGNYAKHF